MLLFQSLVSLLGFLLLFWRLRFLLFRETATVQSCSEFVSIIIPVRNEETNIEGLMRSLNRLQGIRFEVLVVDDHSTDQTIAKAQKFSEELLNQNSEFQVRILESAALPRNWRGKNWACHQGALKARGSYLLFTDADTVHEPWGLRQAVERMKTENLDLLSSTPYHLAPTWWEKLLGPFHLLVLLAAKAFSEPAGSVHRPFSLGQYLLFRRDSYDKQGGHAAISSILWDDLGLAQACLDSGGHFALERSIKLYSVRMFDGFAEFWQGWKRIFRLGFKNAGVKSSLETYIYIATWTAHFRFLSASFFLMASMAASLILIAMIQRRLGQFSIWGAPLSPLSLILFIAISMTALAENLFQRSLYWRGRSYELRPPKVGRT